MKRAVLMMAAAVWLLGGCHKAPEGTPAETPLRIKVYNQYSQGDTLNLVRTELGLDHYEVRYRSGMPDGELGAVYFLPDGNLHVDAQQVGETWVLMSVPVLEPSAVPAEERAMEWDRGSDRQDIRGRFNR